MVIYDNKMKNRLKRANGQMQGILHMMNENQDCSDVITQLSAIRSSVDKLIGLIVAENLKTCIEESTDNDEKEAKIEQAIHLIVKR